VDGQDVPFTLSQQQLQPKIEGREYTVNFRITRRQFLQYCAASAAALGLSQTDLLKLEKAMATPQTGCSSPSLSVVYFDGQNCSGCQTSLLNRVINVTGGYYDADLINGGFGTGVSQGTPNDIGDLSVVNDVADLLVGDAVGTLVPAITPRALPWAGFNAGYVTLEFLHTVSAGAGDLSVDHLNSVVTTGAFVILMDGTVPTGSATNEKFCFVFDDPNNYTGYGPGSVTAADALRWMAPQALAMIAVGTCSSWGGVPAATRQITGAISLPAFLAQEGITTPCVRVPGCPPHPDWIVAPVAHALIGGIGALLTPGYLTTDGRPRDVYIGSNCDNGCRKAEAGFAQFLGQDGCLLYLGCKGASVISDCAARQKNTFDDGSVRNNWCVGNTSAVSTAGIGDARHPCQGCTESDFPDWGGLGLYGMCQDGTDKST